MTSTTGRVSAASHGGAGTPAPTSPARRGAPRRPVAAVVLVRFRPEAMPRRSPCTARRICAAALGRAAASVRARRRGRAAVANARQTRSAAFPPGPRGTQIETVRGRARRITSAAGTGSRGPMVFLCLGGVHRAFAAVVHDQRVAQLVDRLLAVCELIPAPRRTSALARAPDSSCQWPVVVISIRAFLSSTARPHRAPRVAGPRTRSCARGHRGPRRRSSSSMSTVGYTCPRGASDKASSRANRDQGTPGRALTCGDGSALIVPAWSTSGMSCRRALAAGQSGLRQTPLPPHRTRRRSRT